MKIIFLDIDGVLNSIAFDRERTNEQGNIDETRLPLLKQILDETGALIVISSSWRKHWGTEPSLCDKLGAEINNLFAKYDIAIYDKTPQLQGNDRVEEIRLWLSQNKTVKQFVVLDDISFGWGADLQDHLAKTNCRIGSGLERQHVRRAIELLSKGECDRCVSPSFLGERTSASDPRR